MNPLRLDDIRLALRRLRKHVGTTIASVAALACAIGAAVATWSLLSAVLLKPLPVQEPDRLFQVFEPRPNGGPRLATYPYPIFESIRDSGAFDGIAAGGILRLVVIEHGDVPQGRQVYFANHDFFATLGISPIRGRTFTTDEDRRGAPPVAVLSDHYWRSVFNADPNVLGRAVTVSGTLATIVGILPRGFRGLSLSESPDLYLSLDVAGDIDYQLFNDVDPFAQLIWIRIVGRMRPGETAAAAAARLNGLDCLCGRELTQGEVAPLTTLVLVAGAGLFTRSLIEALGLNPAVETDRITVARITLPQSVYTPERAAAFVDELRERLGQNGAVTSVSVTQSLGSAVAGVQVGIDDALRELPSGIVYLAVEEDYFPTIGLPVLRGRNVARSDTASSPPVAVVSESLGRLIAEGGNPIGHRISDRASFPKINSGQPGSYLEIIGVVPDLITNLNDTKPLVVYQSVPPAASPGLRGTGLVLRAVDPGTAMRDATATVRALDPRAALQNMMTLDEQIGRQMNPQRFGIYVLGMLGSVALLLTVLATYVIAESMVVRRRRELGIRAALGAGGAQLSVLVLRDSARLVGIGLIAGLVLAFLGARLIRSLLYQVQPLDPLVLATVSAVIFSLALLVSLRPALEATRLNLTRALREE